MQFFLQYCYSAILNIELHCSMYCKKKKKKIYYVFPPKLLSHQHILRGLFSLFLLCFWVSPFSFLSLKLHCHLRNFSPDSPSPIHPHPSPSLKLHSPIRPHPFTDSPSPILKGFWVWVWVKILQRRSSVGVGGFSFVGVGADCKVDLINVLEFLCLCFFSLSARKKRDSACVCVLIKELLLMFAEVMIFFEWVCSGDDFFFNGFFFELVCSGDDFFDRWPGFQIGGVGFWSVAWVVGVVAVVGSNWFDSLYVCGSVDGLCLCVCVCVALLMVWWFVFVCVVMGYDRLISVSWVCVCGGGSVYWTGARGWGRKRGKKILLESQENVTEKRLERNNKERLKNNILIKIEFWDAESIVKWYGIMIKWLFGIVK